MSMPSHHRPFTEKHINNLTRLATYLESLPKSYKDFDMRTFVGKFYEGTKEILCAENGERMEHYARYNGSFSKLGCGSVACAVGHGPSAGLFVDDKHMQQTWVGYKVIEWGIYAADMFTGAHTNVYDEVDYDTRFEWMFGGEWGSVDNHHWGAAARIRWLLANDGDLPESFIQSEYTPDEADVEEYAEYRITRARPLPKGFYTQEMLDTFAVGEEQAKKFLIDA